MEVCSAAEKKGHFWLLLSKKYASSSSTAVGSYVNDGICVDDDVTQFEESSDSTVQ
jgi:hypothetical protein